MSASDKRIMITGFVGAAWNFFFNDNRYKPIRYFEKTGSLLTLDGSDDDKVCIEGLPNYSPPKVGRVSQATPAPTQFVTLRRQGLF